MFARPKVPPKQFSGEEKGESSVLAGASLGVALSAYSGSDELTLFLGLNRFYYIINYYFPNPAVSTDRGLTNFKGERSKNGARATEAPGECRAVSWKVNCKSDILHLVRTGFSQVLRKKAKESHAWECPAARRPCLRRGAAGHFLAHDS